MGRCFAVEEDFYARHKVIIHAVGGGAALTAVEKVAIWSMKVEVGYDACLDAAYRGLEFAYPGASLTGVRPLDCPPLSDKERHETQAFALRCVGIMATALRIGTGSERALAKQIRDLIASIHLEQPFKAELTRVWDREKHLD